MLGKEFLFGVVRELFLSSSFMGAGTVGFFLFTVASKREEMMANIDDKGKIITNVKSRGTWTFRKEYEESGFILNCSNQELNSSDNDNTCTRLIKSKVSNEKVIYVENAAPTYRDMNQPDYELYKFTYSGNESLEEGSNKEYYGWCDPSEIESGENNVCSSKHLPDVWTKVKVSK